MTITVYASLAEEAKKRLDRIAKKAERYNVPFSYSVSDEHPQKVEVKELDPVEHCWYVTDTYTVSAVDFDIDCEQLIKSSGWTVCAMIEHGDKGNIVTGFNGYDIPPAWYSIPARCDHCNTNRARSVTFMVKRDDGEIKQVGKTCLKDYTGISPATALLWADVRDIECNDMDYDREYFESHSEIRMHSVESILAYAVMDIAKRGYRKSDDLHSTRDYVLSDVKAHAPIDADAQYKAQKIIAWMLERADKYAKDRAELDRLRSLAYKQTFGEPWECETEVIDEEAKDAYDAMRDKVNWSWDSIGDLEVNCFPLVKSGYAKTKHIGRLCYLPIAYDKYLEKKAKHEEREAQKSVSQYIGEVGKRITFCVKESKVIASWDVKVSYYSTRTTFLNKIVDESGNILIWKSSSLLDIKPGMKMKGTVKEHSEYQGEKQTVVTRCAVI